MCASSTDVKEEYQQLCAKLRTISHLEGTMGLLGWDEQTIMPSGAEEARGRQKAALAGVLHQAKVDAEIGELVKSIERNIGELSTVEKANLREAKEKFEQNSRMSAELASKAALLESQTYQAWVRAREEGDFKAFSPHLTAMIDLRKEIVRATKPDLDLYDGAIDSFDPGMPAARIEVLFQELKEGLTPMIREIAEKVAANPEFNTIPAPLRGGPEWDPAKQALMCREVAEAIGFDFGRGRMDVSVHPFTGGSHPSDVRITTRYSEENWMEGVMGTIHECGHAMYEQGRSGEQLDLPVSEALGMATHESQSLLWERCVGQSRPFWRWATPIVHRYFPHTAACTPEDFYRAVNVVKPSLVRVEADEVTYPLHVALRFEIEQGLFQGSLKVDDLPATWNAKMESYLGVLPPDDKLGVLQDVHWSMGALGYFPSYTLGAMMAAQIYDKATVDIPELEQRLEQGDFLPLKAWLNQRIHTQGSVHASADALIEDVTGKKLDPQIFLKYLESKYKDIYKL